GGGADEDLPRPSRLLESCREVDGLARRERRLSAVDDHLARLDTDPGLQLEVVHCLLHRESRPDRALRVVLVGLWDAERGHDRVAGELLDDAAVLLDATRARPEEPRDTAPP